jgi:hypothetical protein
MKKLLLAVVLFMAFIVGYGAAGSAWPGVPDRAQYNGYFTNVHDTNGTYVLPRNFPGPAAIPGYITNAEAFITFLKGPNGLQGNNQQRTGAAFIIQTMIGLSRNRPPNATEMAEWEARVRFAQSRGLVNWRINYTFSINSFFQGSNGGGGTNDDAFYNENDTQNVIMFRKLDGSVAYAIKIECANPVGNVVPIEDDVANFNMVAFTQITANPTPRPGESVSFSHHVGNSGPGPTNPTDIWWVGINSNTGAATGGPANSGTYGAGQYKNVFNETVPVPVGTPAGTTICRQTGYDPVNGTGGRDGRGWPVCATVRYDYSLTPIVNVSINGGATPGSTAEEGDSITFTYIVTNNGSTQSLPTTCTSTGQTYTGYQGAPGAMGPQPPIVCATFPYNSSTTVKTETFVAVGNTTICRNLTVNPSTHNVPPVPATSPTTCAYVANKPYVKVFGGDVSSGSGLVNASGSCTNNANATIIGWNKRNDGPNPWAGAGSQYAALALNAVRDFGTTQLSGGAPAPSGLAFANSGITAAQQNGGTFGRPLGAMGCMPDYFATRPSGATVIGTTVNLNALASNTAYTTSGNTTIGAANFGPGKRVVLFVDGDAYINGNITYTGNWSPSNVPLFELVVRGNLFIAPNVSQLDGVYIAQRRTDGTKGYLYTCTVPPPGNPFVAAPLDGNLFNLCDDNRLTVNGPVMASRVYLMRTLGTLRQSTTGEVRTASNAAEIFNYNAATWIAQPTGIVNASPDEYDSITSLPPIL